MTNFSERTIDYVNELSELHKTGQLVVFAGAGVSMESGLPSWRQLTDKVLRRIGDDLHDVEGRAEIEKAIEREDYVFALSHLEKANPHEFRTFIESIINVAGTPGAVARAIAALSPQLRCVVTTNLDRVLNQAFEGKWADISRATADTANRRHYILRLHGTGADHSTWVFTNQGYNSILQESHPMHRTFDALVRGRTILFVGTSLSDQHLLTYFRSLKNDQPSSHYTIQPDSFPKLRKSGWEEAGMKFLIYKSGEHSQVAQLLRAIADPTILSPPEVPL